MEQVHNSKKRMPCILSEDLAAEWISDNLSEQRISEIATSRFPAEQMEAKTIRKDFQQLNEPTEVFEYAELSSLI